MQFSIFLLELLSILAQNHPPTFKNLAGSFLEIDYLLLGKHNSVRWNLHIRQSSSTPLRGQTLSSQLSRQLYVEPLPYFRHSSDGRHRHNIPVPSRAGRRAPTPAPPQSLPQHG